MPWGRTLLLKVDAAWFARLRQCRCKCGCGCTELASCTCACGRISLARSSSAVTNAERRRTAYAGVRPAGIEAGAHAAAASPGVYPLRRSRVQQGPGIHDGVRRGRLGGYQACDARAASHPAGARPARFFQAEDGIRDYKVTGVQTCALPIRFFFQAEDGIRDYKVTGVQTCALPI